MGFEHSISAVKLSHFIFELRVHGLVCAPSVNDKIRGGKDLKNRVNWVELWSVCSSEKVGDVVLWMVEDILPDLPSASGTQLEVSAEGARSARV